MARPNLTPALLTLCVQEVEAIAANTDPAKGPVFRPSRADYRDTFTLGAKDSKQRSQYDTGGCWAGAIHVGHSISSCRFYAGG